MSTVNVARPTFVEIGDQSQGEYGFYEAKVWIETRGMFSLDCTFYDVTFCTRLNERGGLVSPKAFTISRKGEPVAQHDATKLFEMFLPHLQEKIDNLG